MPVLRPYGQSDYGTLLSELGGLCHRHRLNPRSISVLPDAFAVTQELLDLFLAGQAAARQQTTQQDGTAAQQQ